MSTDLTALAREVLDADKVRDSTPGTLYLDGPTHEHEEAASAILDDAPALARAVIAVAELADRWESVVSSDDYEAAMQNAATDLRAALKGQTEDNLARLRNTPAGKQLMAEGWGEVAP